MKLFPSVLLLAVVLTACSKKKSASDPVLVRYEVLPAQPGDKAASITYRDGSGNDVRIASSNNRDSIPLPWSIEVRFNCRSGTCTAVLGEEYFRPDPSSLDTRRIYVNGTIEMEGRGNGIMQVDF